MEILQHTKHLNLKPSYFLMRRRSVLLFSVLWWSALATGAAIPPSAEQTRQWNEMMNKCLVNIKGDLTELSKSEPLLSGIDKGDLQVRLIDSGEGQVNEISFGIEKSLRYVPDNVPTPSTEAEKRDPRFIRPARAAYVIDKGGILLRVGFSIRSVDYGFTKVYSPLPGTANLASKQGIVPYYDVEVSKENGSTQNKTVEKIVAIIQKNLDALYAKRGSALP